MSAASADHRPLVICSKSTWSPAIRREHALARLASGAGHPVRFIERPHDVRAMTSPGGARDWWRGMRMATSAVEGYPGVTVAAHSTVLPGHLNSIAEATSTALLRRELRAAPAGAALVVNVPWQWPATDGAAGRRVFDCADDWSSLMPHRADRLNDLYEQIGLEADAVILASPSLAGRFPGERTTVVRNGVSEEMLGPVSPAPAARRLVHAGTLTPRFDAELARTVLDALPGWTLELYGQCQYPGCGEEPGPELERLLSGASARVSWHGVLSRSELAAAIDRGSVALVLNRPERSLGQDSMKLYDYGARGRPIVTTRFSPTLETDGPPHLRICDTAEEMAAAVLEAEAEAGEASRLRREWAEQHRWESRWPAWSRAVFGA